jgi:cobalt-zinc-cadmium efflux system protein
MSAQHDHSHGHSHGHTHGHSQDGNDNARRIAIAFFLIFTFTFVEVAGGILSGSLALLADAGHMVSDAAALGMSWLAIHIGRRPADKARSYGYQRLEVLAAFVNGCTLFAITGWILFEAVSRFMAPVPVLGGPMLAVAIAGLIANLLAFYVLHGGNRDNLNVRSAWLHVLGDILGSAVAIVAAIVIMFTAWTPIDPILSVVVAVLILRSAYHIVRSSAHILLEGTPPGIDPEDVRKTLQTLLPAEADVHHVHVWAITGERAIATLHVCGLGTQQTEQTIAAMRSTLKDSFGIEHATIQIEPDECIDEKRIDEKRVDVM